MKSSNFKNKYYKDLKENCVYTVKYKSKGNGDKAPKKTRFHNKNVVIKKNNPKNDDIPSFEHGFVHIYDAETNEYYGACGIFYFARSIGFKD